MRRSILLLMVVMLFCAWGDSWNQGDLRMQKNSITGDSTDGLKFDPNSDGVDNITMTESSLDMTQSGEFAINMTDDVETSHSLTVGSDGNLYIDGVIKT